MRLTAASGGTPARHVLAQLLAAGCLLSVLNVLVPGYVRSGPGALAVFGLTIVGAAVSAYLVARFGIPPRYILPAALAGDANAVAVLWSLQHPAAAGPIVLTLGLPTMLVALFGTVRDVVVQVVAAVASAGVILTLAGDGWPEIVPHLLLTAYASAGSAYIVMRLRLRLETTLQSARHQSVTDELTALHNRRGFEHLASAVVAEAARLDRPVAVLLGDVDHFKRVNDTFGHAVGDEVLRTVAEALRVCVRDTDVVARLGGEEFAVLTVVPPENVPALAERIRGTIAEACADWGVTISIGASWSPLAVQSPEAVLDGLWKLVSEADARMFQAKHEGRNCVRTPVSGESPVVSPSSS